MGNILIPAASAEEWKRFLADPGKQWKPGYSARTLAYCWQEADGFPKSIKKVFNKSKVDAFRELEVPLAIAEHQVPLPGGAQPSQNDIWVLAKCSSGLVSIAVEGKVSEPFGPTVDEWIKNRSAGKKRRLEFLCNLLGLAMPIPNEVRYQLIHRAGSAIIEAKRFNASYAMMLVHSFSKNDKWFDDYSRFLSIMGASANPNEVVFAKDCGGIAFYCAWVRGEERYLHV
jgi:hypothetical protein